MSAADKKAIAATLNAQLQGPRLDELVEAAKSFAILSGRYLMDLERCRLAHALSREFGVRLGLDLPARVRRELKAEGFRTIGGNGLFGSKLSFFAVVSATHRLGDRSHELVLPAGHILTVDL
jgi:hypothetical protein